ncbi:TPA: glycosyltransferase [Klebsiella aerogenes]|nr:glycosyltransferase [Klebsiella aerogenes]HCT3750087.1 glycosyltransferase [Klebsiella aerogenes]HCT8622793.1 glycosyltransferase [Klebsiella aerogenes]HCT8631738.1 glycosyltransferase [Klebsiella aerogenes]HCT8715634.1 glycosyltransferase [Klebsiella aerogenes]
MNKKEVIAVVFTAAIVGGHELMTIAHLNKFRNKGFRFACFVPSDNIALKKILSDHNIAYENHEVLHKKFEILHSTFNYPFRKKAKELLVSLKGKHKTIIIVQGDIELGSVFVNTSKAAGVKNLVSYIPYAHSFRLMGSKLGWLKDILSKFVYKKCENYITISKVFAEQISLKNKNAKVRVLHNFSSKLPIEYIRGKGYIYKKDEDKFTILMAGRVSFRQKGQDILFQALNSISTSKEIVLKVIGDGPDLEKLKTITGCSYNNIRVNYYGWQPNVWEYSKDVDLITLPSRFEGVPLLMLEAKQANIPIIAPARDGMIDFLPPTNLYEPGSRDSEAAALAKKIQTIINNH